MRLFRSVSTWLWVSALLTLAGSALAAPPAGYYNAINTSSAVTLRSSLHARISGHIKYPYTSSGTDTWDILELAQQDPSNASNIVDVYRNRSLFATSAGGGGYDREHTWPKNHGVGYNEAEPQHTDCHALFLSDSTYNSTRGNIPFGSCTSGCTSLVTDVYAGEGGTADPNRYSTAGLGSFQVWSGRRGDIARALFYMDVRYEGGSEVDLVLTDNDSLIQQAMNQTADGQPTPPIGYSGRLATLLQWHLEDPVDARDEARNDVVYAFQNNRNPFVDHPEWVSQLYGGTPAVGCVTDSECDDALYCTGVEHCNAGTCVAGTPPCSGGSCNETTHACSAAVAWISEFHYDNVGADTGEAVEIAGPAGLNLQGYQLVAYNGASTSLAPYDTLALSGVIPNQGGCGGALSFPLVGMQNGSPDGLALVNPSGVVLEFISYEGSFTAASGAAAGMTSVDVGAQEGANTQVGYSLARVGTPSSGFTWYLGPATFGTSGPFALCPAVPVPVLAGSNMARSVFAALLSMIGMAFATRRAKRVLPQALPAPRR